MSHYSEAASHLKNAVLSGSNYLLTPESQCVGAQLPLALPDEVAALGLTQQLVSLLPGDHPVEPGRGERSQFAFFCFFLFLTEGDKEAARLTLVHNIWAGCPPGEIKTASGKKKKKGLQEDCEQPTL